MAAAKAPKPKAPPRGLNGGYVKKFMAAKLPNLRRARKTWFPRLTGQVVDLYHDLEIFHELVQVVKANPATVQPPVFFNWLWKAYVSTIAVGIRRQTDVDYRSISLGRLLLELELRPDLITRRSYRAMMKTKGIRPHEADESLRRIIGSLTYMSAMAKKDFKRLSRAEERIRRLVNKRIAHTGPISALRRPPTFAEIENAVEEIDQIFVKYDSLVAGGTLSSGYAVMLRWSQVLERPWLQPGQHRLLPKYTGPRHNQL